MIGKFLEFSVATPDIRESLDFYVRLGFSQAEVGEAWTHPYAVLTDGRLCIGLHQDPDFGSSATFVKPDLLKHLAPLEALGIEFEFRRVGYDVFNEVGWRDPSGHLIRLLEARTFSPGRRSTTGGSLCGYFVEIGLPSPSVAQAQNHWERLGFVGMNEADAGPPHVSCTSDTVDVGLYDPADLHEPALVFDAADRPATLARLQAVGIAPGRRVPPPLRQDGAVLLTAPEGTRIVLIGAPSG